MEKARQYSVVGQMGKGIAYVLASALWLGAKGSVAVADTSVHLQERLFAFDLNPPAMRFRFVMADMPSDIEYTDMADLMFALCRDNALPNLGDYAAGIGQIVVSVADKETEFGVMNPDVKQYFEAFQIVDGACEWGEVFE